MRVAMLQARIAITSMLLGLAGAFTAAPASAQAAACGTCPTGLHCHEGQCKSSVKDASSPDYSRSCKLTHQLATPTSLPSDCRCLDNRSPKTGIDACKRPFDTAKAGTTIGAGPSFALYENAHLSGGFIDTAKNALVASVYWDGSSTAKGLVVSYDLKTWARTFVSGEWKDGSPKSTGSGPAFAHLKDIKPGKDGKWYALSYKPQRAEIFRIEPASGNRTVVWAGGDPKFGQCASGDKNASTPEQGAVQYTHEGFAVDADGSFLLGYANTQRDGRGIVRVSADGTKCAYVTASGKRPDGMTRGTGDEMRGFVQGFTVHNGAIWAHTTQEKKLWSIDPATGDRTVVADKPLGERATAWDAKRSVLWSAGFMNSTTLAAFDPKTKKFMNVFADCGGKGPAWFPLCAEGVLRINSLNYGPILVHPTTGNLFIGHDSVGLVEFEPETGNSITRSL
jgi:hypothetical protein